jgi:aquaporin NIP
MPVSVPPYPTRLAAEFLGTFGFLFLGFSGIAASIDHPGLVGLGGVAAGFGLGLAMMIFAFGHICGGHFNPAVTLGLAVGRQFPIREVLGYWLMQVLGAVLAAGAASALYSEKIQDALVNHPSGSDGQTLVAELIGTALFLIVISAVATDDRAAWKPILAPLAIGGFIFVAATVIGPFTGGSFNPARSLAPAILAADSTNLWLYIVGPLAGGIIGGFVYWLVRTDMGSTREAEALDVNP